MALLASSLVVAACSSSLANLRRDACARCILQSSPTYYQIKGVTAHGKAKEGPIPAGTGTPKGVVFSLPLD